LLFGPAGAATHTLLGGLAGAAIQHVLFLGYRQMPFACAYAPIENPKIVWPAAAAVFLLFSNGFATLVRPALQSPHYSVLLALILLAATLLTALADRRMRRDRLPVLFEQRLPAGVQRLDLFEHSL
jgi:hypothetical protein